MKIISAQLKKKKKRLLRGQRKSMQCWVMGTEWIWTLICVYPYDTETWWGRQSCLPSTKKDEVMFVFLLEGGDVRQPLVRCVLSWLRSSLWSAGLRVFKVKRCWPKEDLERLTLVQSWGFLRLVQEPTSLHVVSKCRQWTQLGDRNLSPSTVMIAVAMAVTVCRATARQIAAATSSVQNRALMVLGQLPEVQTWEGNTLHDGFGLLNCF